MFNKKMSLKEKQRFIEKETRILEHLEEMGKVEVNDVDNISELIEVLGSMNYITCLDDEYLILENKEEKEQERTGKIVRKLYKHKAGSGSYTYKVNLPADFVRELNLEEDEEIYISLENESIVIRKIEE